MVPTCLLAAVGLLKLVHYQRQDGTILHLTLNEMGHPQTEATPIYVDNTMAVDIINKSIKKQRSRAINMCYLWVVDQVTLNNLFVI